MKKITLLFAAFLLFEPLFAQTGSAPMPTTSGNSLEFIPNKGQIADMNGKVRKDILYLAHDGAVQVYLRDKGLSYVISTLKANGMEEDETPAEEINAVRKHLLKLRNVPFKNCRVDMDFVGVSIPLTQNTKPTEGYTNYYYPQCPDGITGVKGYENVLYKGIYPNIDVSFGHNASLPHSGGR